MAKFFDPSQFKIVFGGVAAEGFSENAMASFEFEVESTGDVAGVDGDVSRSVNQDRRAKLTVSLMSTSPTNDLYGAMYAAQRSGANGSDVAALRVEDLNGNLVISGPEAWIMDTPKPNWGKTATEYQWVIRIANCEAFFGGH